MKRLILILVLLFAPAVLGCASKKLTPETPKAAVAMKADAVVIRLNELQAAVIQSCVTDDACVASGIGKDLARLVVQTCIDIRSTLRDVPNGWQATARTAWAQVRSRLALVRNPVIQSVFALVDAALQEI